MMQIIEQTHDEKVAMYMKLKKAKLIEMLIHCNEILDSKPAHPGWDLHSDHSVSITKATMTSTPILPERFY